MDQLLADARNTMVDGQLRPNKVNDRRILDAMRRLPRERFVPVAQQALAYADTEVPIGQGRVLLEPVTLARLIQAAEPTPGCAVLVIGAGYAAAVFAAIGARVTAVEQDPLIAAAMRDVLTACGGTVALVEGLMSAGWAANGPYDVVFIDGAVSALPALAEQLRAAPPGRLCGIVVRRERGGIAVLAERAGSGLAQRSLFDCKATPLPQFVPPPRFVF